MPFRFLIAPVMVDALSCTFGLVEKPAVMIEAPNYNSAAAEAESRWPGQQVMVIKVGRIHNAGASDQLPMESGAGN